MNPRDHRPDFYLTRLAPHELSRLAHMANQCCSQLCTDDGEPVFWAWTFGVVIEEMQRRGKINEGEIIEPESICIPEWWDEITVLRSLKYATDLTYIESPAPISEFGDWAARQLLNRLTVMTILRMNENAISHY